MSDKKTKRTNQEQPAAKKSGKQYTVFEDPAKRGRVILTLIAASMVIFAVLLIVLFIVSFAGKEPKQVWGVWLCYFLNFIFSWGALSVPVLTIYAAYFLPKVIENKLRLWNLILAASICLSISLLVGVIVVKPGETDMNIKAVWESSAVRAPTGGGLIGTYVGWLLVKALSKVGAMILIIATMFVQAVFLVGLTLDDAWAFFRKQFRRLWGAFTAWIAGIVEKIRKKRAARHPEKHAAKNGGKNENADGGEDDEDDEFVPPEQPAAGTIYRNKPQAGDNPYADPSTVPSGRKAADVNPYAQDEPDVKDKNGISTLPKPEVIPRPGVPEGWGDPDNGGKKTEAGGKQTAAAGPEPIDLDEIFSDKPKKNGSEQLSIFSDVAAEQGGSSSGADGKKRTVRVSASAPGKPEEEKKVYVFPPISLLTAIPAKQTDVSEELTTNARKLVETLRAFKVGTKVVNISRGPTITRYELQPEEGVRVKAIANLVDDISLNLATAGVRIEAPIPGKPAVGVEVPNHTRETVYLRTLIENHRFAQAQAKLTAAVGVDVAGDPIFVDLAKMPHLLIAGTTGSGKSVCLNCLILSVLFKASPDEVKFIMIDPKKVEFNVYNGLPHLIIPVVSNAKKAAGALSWAVSEMERRYELIEQVGVRDIMSYNKVTANDPEREYMPQLLIVIDELADLMMTAPAEVEESICRIAQKGRAAGTHLIIGTQRPSVDVITGLIKANVPSRIAFTVSSQVDSRTIIDIAGAEKLIGRGDMLFAPVGAMKPARLQGAFVSDEEVESVTTFIKEHSEEAIYDDNVMRDIEREAALCGSKGKKAAGPEIEGDLAGEDGDSDPMLKAAIDLAVESGKISTSLIQRRLSLGYGRAAKLIDEMEKRGIVSPPEGQKPRNVLISASEWNEMCMRASDEA